MKILRKGIMVDILKKENEYLIVNNQNFQFIKIKKNKIVDFVIYEIEKAPIMREKLLEKSLELNLNETEIQKVVQGLINLNVIKESFFPTVENYEEFIHQDLLENYFDKRFGNMIISYEEIENDGISRFDLFKKMKDSSIIILGAGGVGGHIAIMAAASGVGEITLIDKDIVEPSNLTRQTFYKEYDCNTVKKCESLKRYIKELNSAVKVNIIDDYVDNIEKALTYLKNCSLVVQTADKPRGQLNNIVNEACIYNEVPLIFCQNSSIGPFYIPKETGCYFCYMKKLKSKSNEMYTYIDEIASNHSSIVWPSSASGPMIASYYLFQEIINFLLMTDEVHTKNAVLSLRKFPLPITKDSFPLDNQCSCQLNRGSIYE